MTTISNVKEHIAGILPEKILKAFTAYDDFSRIPPSEGVKELNWTIPMIAFFMSANYEKALGMCGRH